MASVTLEQSTGWIPYIDRTKEQRRQTDEFHAEINAFGDVGQQLSYDELPELVYQPAIYRKVTGKRMFRVYQTIGSCVGASAGVAQCLANAMDVHFRNTHEEVPPIWWLASYGFGREFAGMRRKGSGSYGAAQARASQEVGTLRLKTEGLTLPQPSVQDEVWTKFTSSQETQYSLPPFPEEAAIRAESEKHQITTVVRIKEKGELLNLLAQGYTCTIACNFGSRNMKVKDGVLMAEYNGSWAHQQTIIGYWKHPTLGLILFVANQWGPSSHDLCPFQNGKHQFNGAYAVYESTIDYFLTQELYGHANTEGWPLREPDWDEIVWDIPWGN